MALRIAQQAHEAEPGWWQWAVWIAGEADELGGIERVRYVLHPSFPSPVRVVTERESGFRLDESGWGGFRLVANVDFHDGRQQRLEHDLRLDPAATDDDSATSVEPAAGAGEERPRRSTIPVPRWMMRTAAVLAVLAAAGGYLLYVSWPDGSGIVRIAGDALQFRAGRDPRLLMVAAFAGMLGGTAQALAVLANVTGNRYLHVSWAAWFVLRPLTGAVVAVVAYLVLREFLFSAGAQPGDVNEVAVALLGALAGAFADRAVSSLSTSFSHLYARVVPSRADRGLGAARTDAHPPAAEPVAGFGATPGEMAPEPPARQPTLLSPPSRRPRGLRELHQALWRARETEDWTRFAVLATRLGRIHHGRGDQVRARQLFTEALRAANRAVGGDLTPGDRAAEAGGRVPVGASRGHDAQETVTREELPRAPQLDDRVLAALSHELRMSLNGILGRQSLVLDGISGEVPEAVRRQLVRANDSARALLHLADDLLDYTRLEAGRLAVAPVDVNVRDVVADAVAAMQPLAAEKGIALESRVNEAAAHVRADPDKLRQIIHNLLSNALQFTDSGSVTVSAAPVAGASGGQWMEVRVRDTGPGIAPEDQERIFLAFEQVPGMRRGTGLGLTVSRRLAQLLGGDLRLESEPGAGSTFILRLPLASTPSTTSAPAAAATLLPD